MTEVKTIDTLIEDINKVLDGEVAVADEDYEDYGREQATVLEQRLDTADAEANRGGLRLSSIGAPCARKLWYSVHTPNEREHFTPATKLKFLYGDLTETLVLELARKAGHLVEGEQDSLLVDGVKGHRDCVIDGMLVDVKTASPHSFARFQSGLESADDSFGYLTQLGSYLLGSQDDELVTYKNEAAFLAFNKVSGGLCLDRHTFTDEDFDDLETLIAYRKTLAEDGAGIPDRGFESINQNKPNKKGWVNGNLKLGTNCSYCINKEACWPELRTFLYGNGPVFLTHVEKLPNVFEVVKDG